MKRRERNGTVSEITRKDGSKRFVVRYWVRGETKRRWELQAAGTTRSAATRRLRELTSAAERGELAIQRGVPFETCAQRWPGPRRARALGWGSGAMASRIFPGAAARAPT